MTVTEIQELFESNGGKFISSPRVIQEKLKNIKAYIFDWDGVFNTGTKGESKSSNYSEVDAMGTNMLRLGYWLDNGGELPIVSIITGERNKMAEYLAERENFHLIYFKFKNKEIALNHLLETYNLEAHQVAFFFDDILDFSIVPKCGLRFMISRAGSPLLNKYAIENKFVDYMSGQPGGSFAVREVIELILGLNNQYNKALDSRIKFGSEYKNYLNQRDNIHLQRFVFKNYDIEAQ